MARFIIEIDSDYLPQIKRRKTEYILMIKQAETDDQKKKELSTRFGTTLINVGPPYEKVVINVDGETVYRR